MGSTGTGRFSDYPGERVKNENGEIIAGGKSSEDKCEKAFTAELEEIERCSYFQSNSNIPNKGTEVYLKVDKRLSIIESKTDLVVGYLPTSLNYLAQCVSSGFKYIGNITLSNNTPIPYIRVDMSPEK